MSDRIRSRVPISAGIAFVVLAVAGNALQGSTPALHGDAGAIVRFYTDGSTRIAVAMMLSLISLFFLTVFLAALGSALEEAETRGGWASGMARNGGAAAVALLAGGFALNSAGALRAGNAAPIAPETAVVFYDAGLVLSGLAAPLGMAVLLAATAVVAIRSAAFPRWFGWTSGALAVLGIVTPVSFVMFLLFPVWVVAACVVLTGHRAPTDNEFVPSSHPR
jgi:hypothetical protein